MPATPGATYLREHRAVARHGRGVSTPDLTSFLEALGSYEASRVAGIGARQYLEGDRQRFETYTMAETVAELLDEIADARVYLAFLAIKLLAVGRLGEAFQ